MRRINKQDENAEINKLKNNKTQFCDDTSKF